MHKPNDLKFTDMAIWVDKHARDDDVDETKLYNYIVNLVHMLTVVNNLFNNENDNVMYSYYLGNIVYIRLTTKRQYLDTNDPMYLKPIKSCLNYIKSVLYAKKCNYSKEEFQYTSDGNDVNQFETIKKTMLQPIRSQLGEWTSVDILEYFKNIKDTVWYVVKNSVYGNDANLSYELYLSCMITLLKGITFDASQKSLIKSVKDAQKLNNVVQRCCIRNVKAAPTVFRCDEKYTDYVSVLVQYIRQIIAKDVSYISKSYDYPDDVLCGSILSEVLGGDSNNEK